MIDGVFGDAGRKQLGMDDAAKVDVGPIAFAWAEHVVRWRCGLERASDVVADFEAARLDVGTDGSDQR